MSLYDTIITENPQDKQIRLLTLSPAGHFDDPINISLTTHALSTLPNYEALSYFWGTEKCPTGIDIEVNNWGSFPLTITQNLDTALRHLRSETEHRVLWIDAICINQDSIPERNDQVQMMGAIYEKAARVVVWAGPEADGSAMVLSWVNSDAVMTGVEYPEFARGMYYFLSRPWFSRVWIIQEVSLSSTPPILQCGHDKAPFYAFTAWAVREESRLAGNFSTLQDADIEGIFPRILDPLEQMTREDSAVNDIRLINFDSIDLKKLACSIFLSRFTQKVVAATDIHTYRGRSLARDFSLGEVYFFARDFKATDLRDKAFALYGLCSNFPSSSALLPDYTKSPTTVLIEIMAGLVSHNFITPYMFWYLRPDMRSCPGFPSWLPDLFAPSTPDYSTPPARADTLIPFFQFPPLKPNDTRQRIPLASIDVEARTLNVAGKKIGSITSTFAAHATEKHTPFKDHCVMLANLFRFFHLHGIPWRYGLELAFDKIAPTPTPMPPEDEREDIEQPPPPPPFDSVVAVGLGAEKLHPRHPFFPFFQRFNRGCYRHWFFVLDDGRWGVTAGVKVEVGDEVVGLFASESPFVLRREESGDGEATEGWRMVHPARVAGWEVNEYLPDVVDEGAEDVVGMYGMEEFVVY